PLFDTKRSPAPSKARPRGWFIPIETKMPRFWPVGENLSIVLAPRLATYTLPDRSRAIPPRPNGKLSPTEAKMPRSLPVSENWRIVLLLDVLLPVETNSVSAQATPEPRTA